MSLSSKLKERLKHALLRVFETVISKTPLSPADFKHDKIRRILIIRQHGQLRDLLLATPVFRAVRQNFPGAYIAVLTLDHIAQVLYHNRNLDEVICFFEKISDWSVKKVFRFLRHIRSKFDLAIVLNPESHSLTSDLLAYLSGAKFILGSECLNIQTGQRNFIYNLLAPCANSQKHQTERNLDIVRFIHIDAEDKSEQIFLTPQESRWALEFLDQNGLQPDDLILCIHLGAVKIRDRWGTKKFVELAKYFSSKHNAKIILSCEPNEIKLRRYFLNSLPFKPVEAVGLTLRELSAVISFCDVIFCGDTGVMHLAAGVGTPFVAIFGTTDPEEWKPIGKQFVALQGEQGNCNSITVEQVRRTAEKLLKMYPKYVKVEAEDFEISEQVLERYINILNEFDKK
jgi:ADP-heptose:LPS heptosyltransferase